jgi:hypothetical protein
MKKGFCPQTIIDGLVAGKSINLICKENNSYPTTVYKWRKKDPAFDEQVLRLIGNKLNQEKSRFGKAYAKFDESLPPLEKFFYWYQRTKDRKEACKYSNLKPSEVQNALDPNHEDFNEKLSDDMLEESITDKWFIEDQELQRAVLHGDKTAQRLFLKEKIWNDYTSKLGDSTQGPTYVQLMMGDGTELLERLMQKVIDVSPTDVQRISTTG